MTDTPTPDRSPELPGGHADGMAGDPAPSVATGSIASATEGEASLLDRARHARIVDGMIDLTMIREFAFALPDRAGVTERLNEQLEELDAMLFHILFQTRTRVAQEIVKKYLIEPNSSKPRKEKPSVDDLLADL